MKENDKEINFQIENIIKKNVYELITNSRLASYSDIGIVVKKGTIFIFGQVATMQEKRSIEELIASKFTSCKLRNQLVTIYNSEYPYNDSDILDKVRTKLSHTLPYSTEIELSIKKGLVFVKGECFSEEEIFLIENCILETEGVTSIQNELGIYPSTIRDDLILKRVKNILYADLSVEFSNIRMVVKDGIIHFSGLIPSKDVAKKIKKMIKDIPGIREIKDNFYLSN